MTRAAEGRDELASSECVSGERRCSTRCGELIGGTYRLLERIGSGGMGEVYSAEHTRLGRQFAVKLLRADGETKAIERFRREAKAIARAQNEFVVAVVDCGETTDGTPYLVMELLLGEDLRCLLERLSPLPIPRVVSLICDACEGVAAVHRAGLVHRDLKPGNLFVTRRSTGEDWCKVLDFGVAKMECSTSTAEGALVGTVKYMAPEQLLDGASAGSQVDIYALGAILYESLSGVAPHSGASVQELMFKIMNEEPVLLDERRREVPAGLASAVQRALSKQPADRFATAQEFARVITPFARVAGVAALAESETVNGGGREDSKPQRSWAPRRGWVAVSLLIVGVWVATRFAAHPEVSSRAPGKLVPTTASPPVTAALAEGPASAPAVSRGAVEHPAASEAAVRSSPRRKAPLSVSFPKAKFDSDNPYGR